MGKLFTFSEMRLGAVPSPETDFPKALRILAEDLSGTAEVVGALVFGSALRRDHDERSDIDVLVVLSQYDQQTLRQLMRIFLRVRALHIPLQFVFVDEELGELGIHTITADLRVHLEWAEQRSLILSPKKSPEDLIHSAVIKQNPLLFIKPMGQMVDATTQYIAGKFASLLKHYISFYSESEEAQAQALGKALDISTYLARKMLFVKGVELSVDRKDAVGHEYVRHFPPHLQRLYREIEGIRRRAKNMQKNMLKDPDRATHQRYFEYIHGEVPKIMEFVRQNGVYLAELLKEKKGS